MTEALAVPVAKRQWHYLQQPAAYEMAPCSCGNHETQWSEFAKHLWCAKCEKDFVPEHAGIFDGPIASKLALMLGVSFDRFNLVMNRVERFNLDTMEYEVDGQSPANGGALDSVQSAP
jgi:hypothetical protein